MRFHHLGVAVRSLDKAVACYRDLFAYRVLSGPCDDPIQRVTVCFLGADLDPGFRVELVAPLGEDSPLGNLLKRNVGAYHACYEVDDLDAALDRLRAAGCRIVAEPVPAVAFAGRRIAWLYTPVYQLVELLECRSRSSNSTQP